MPTKKIIIFVAITFVFSLKLQTNNYELHFIMYTYCNLITNKKKTHYIEYNCIDVIKKLSHPVTFTINTLSTFKCGLFIQID